MSSIAISNRPNTWGQACVELVDSAPKPVFELCKFFMQSRLRFPSLRTIPRLYSALPLTYPRSYPRKPQANNRGVFGLIPTVHRPNKENYMGILRKIKGKTVEERVL